MMNDFTQSFALDYAGARTKFRATARDLGCALSEYRHPAATGPDGQGLFIDVARLESTTEQAISITQQAVEGLASWSLGAAA
jgi:uncharacterized protein DUF2817